MTARLASAILLLCVIAPAEKKPIPWETAHVVAQNIGSQNRGVYAAPIGTGVIGVPIYMVSNVVTVDVGRIRYQWLESRNRHPLVLTVNTDIQFYRDKNWFVILDSGGSKHKFSLVGSEAR